MIKQTKIYIFNFATVVFAVLTVLSAGSFNSLPVYTAFVNTALFSLLTYTCYTKEMALRRQLKARRHRKVALSVYTSAQKHHAA